MPILNYTTKVSAERTSHQIQSLLSRAGADAVMTQYVDGQIAALSFRITVMGAVVSYRMPIRVVGVLKAMEKSKGVRRSMCNEEQARRVAWRIVKDWVEAQVALVEAEQAELAEVFLPYMVRGDEGPTLYQHLTDTKFKLLEKM